MRRIIALIALIAALSLLTACNSRAQTDITPGAIATNTPPKQEVKLDGKILFSRDRTIWSWSGGSAKQVGKDTSVQQASWSPDGKRIAYVSLQADYSDIWVMNSSGGDQTNLTKFGRAGADTWALRPRWSPDGSQLAYVSDQNTYDLALWLMKADGSGRKQITQMNDYLGGIDGPAWSSKGDRIAFTAYRTGKSQVWAMTLANSKWQMLTDIDEGSYDPQWSPSDDTMAFVARSGGKSNVWIVTLPDGSPVQVTRDGVSRSPVWSPDGKVLAFFSGQGGSFDMWAVNLDRAPDGTLQVSTPKRVTQGLNADPGGGLSWTR